MKLCKRFIALLTVIVLFASICATDASAQKTIGAENAISANPLGLVIGIFNATFEHKLSQENSFTINALYYSIGDWWTAFGVGGSYRWYLFPQDKKPFEGFGFGPFVSVEYWKSDYSALYDYLGYDDGGAMVSIGAEAAYKWNFGGFVVEPVVRYALPLMSFSGLSYQSYGLGCNLGYAW